MNTVAPWRFNLQSAAYCNQHTRGVIRQLVVTDLHRLDALLGEPHRPLRFRPVQLNDLLVQAVEVVDGVGRRREALNLGPVGRSMPEPCLLRFEQRDRLCDRIVSVQMDVEHLTKGPFKPRPVRAQVGEEPVKVLAKLAEVFLHQPQTEDLSASAPGFQNRVKICRVKCQVRIRWGRRQTPFFGPIADILAPVEGVGITGSAGRGQQAA